MAEAASGAHNANIVEIMITMAGAWFLFTAFYPLWSLIRRNKRDRQFGLREIRGFRSPDVLSPSFSEKRTCSTQSLVKLLRLVGPASAGARDNSLYLEMPDLIGP
jgi:hypothetical protein